MKKQIKITVCTVKQYDLNWPRLDAIEFLGWLTKKFSEIPVEYINTANIEIDTIKDDSNNSYACIEIYYYRPETDEEVKIREIEEQHNQELIKINELKIFAALKEKYKL